MPFALLALAGFLILYGSVYPFDFRPPPPGAWDLLWSNWQWFTSRGDVLGNTLLFVPLGLAGFIAFRPRRNSVAAALLTLMLAGVLALVAQIAQFWTPQRDPALSDVLWNMVGSVLGVVLARPLLARLSMPADQRERGIALALLGMWIGSELLPLVPSLDFQLLKDNLRAALGGPLFTFAAFAPRVALAMLAAELLHRIGPPLNSRLVLALLLAAVALLRLVMIDADMAPAIPLGLAVGAGLWLAIARLRSRQRAALIVLALILGYTLEALSPFRFRDVPAGFSWLPFAALLEGSMLINLRALLTTVTMTAGCLYLLRAIGMRLLAPTLMLAVWVLLLELLQVSIETRSADITPALLVLVIGWLIGLLPRIEPRRRSSRGQSAATAPAGAAPLELHPGAFEHRAAASGDRPRPSQRQAPGPGVAAPPLQPSAPPRRESYGESHGERHREGRHEGHGERHEGHGDQAHSYGAPARAEGWRTPALVAAASAILIAGAMRVVLALPGIPYNVREMFRGDGNLLALLAFALALLWIGAGAVWLGQRLAASRHAGLLLWPAALGVGLVSLALMWSGVTTESLEDVAGSTNLFWFVTHQDSWGVTMRALFLWLDAPEVIGFLERCVRYAALYAPVPVLLGTMLALRTKLGDRNNNGWWAAGLIVSAVLLLWLCKLIAFTWSSTDNLNELIAHPGPLGIKGGIYLYLLMLMLCLNALALAWAARRGIVARVAVAAATLLALAPGWWLLNLGLDPSVEKYGSVFSGAQFLLGPDRTHLMSGGELFARWSVVQLGGVVIMALGIWLAKAAPLLEAVHGTAARFSTGSRRTSRHRRRAA